MPSRSRALIAVVLVATSLVGCAASSAKTEQSQLWRETPSAATPPELLRFNELLADLADRLKPALVHVRVRRGGPPAKDDSDSPAEPRRSTGSGFVIEPTGMIVTNAHVVEHRGCSSPSAA